MYRLIVVDDDADAVNNIAKDFPWEQSGFTLVGTFRNGESALAWLKMHTVDLILCDIKMVPMFITTLSQTRMKSRLLAADEYISPRKSKVITTLPFKPSLKSHICGAVSLHI